MNESTLGTGAGILALRQGAASDVTLPLSLGLRADTAWRLDSGLRLTAFARGAWVREEGGGVATTAAFALAPDQTFRIEGPAMSRDRLAFNLGIQLEPHERLGFGFGVLGDVSDRSQSVAAFGRVMLRW
jgi:outer membrane autotransporter protein